MARTGVVDSATSQFFINLDNNDFLDHGSRDFGYAVFGKVISGEQVVETIGKVPTTSRSGHQNVPVNPVTIIKRHPPGRRRRVSPLLSCLPEWQVADRFLLIGFHSRALAQQKIRYRPMQSRLQLVP